MRDFQAELRQRIKRIDAESGAVAVAPVVEAVVEQPKPEQPKETNAKYTIYKIIPSVGRKPVAFNLQHKTACTMLRSALKPSLVRLVGDDVTELDAVFTSFEAVNNSDPSDVIKVDYQGDGKSTETPWID